MNNLSKEEILASSSRWVASLLNLFPGLGTGYIYQRRWVPYFLTIGAVTLWSILGLVLRGDSDQSDKDQLIGISGLFLISIVTVIDSYIAHNRAVTFIEKNTKKSNEVKKTKNWFKR